MKTVFLFILMLSFRSFADTSVVCELTSGIYQNSRQEISDIRFETVTDIFSINNARTLTFTFEGKRLRLLRSEIKVAKYTQIIFHQKKNDEIHRTAIVMIDRTPKKIIEDGEFNGNMIISSLIRGKPVWLFDQEIPKYTYNFKCRL